MKRITVLFLMLCVASVAQASFFLTVNGQDVTTAVVPTGGTATIGVWSTDGVLVPEPTVYGMYGQYHELWSSSSSGGLFSGGVAKAAAGSSAVPFSWGSAPQTYDHWNTLNPTDVSAGQWFEWTFTNVGGNDTIYLSTMLADWSTVITWDSVAITNVPEPTTMTLLGLGVVALFRKK